MTLKMKRSAVAVGTGLVLTGSLIVGAPGAAQAATVRPGANTWQTDLLLDSYETEQVRRSPWAASVVCWNSNLATRVTFGACVQMVTICAAGAYYAKPRRNAGMTFTPWGRFWCWKY